MKFCLKSRYKSSTITRNEYYHYENIYINGFSAKTGANIRTHALLNLACKPFLSKHNYLIAETYLMFVLEQENKIKHLS